MGYNFIFIVQGEGRGHLTQALALKAILEDAGHRIAAVLVGGNAQQPRMPAFFENKIGAPITHFESLNFEMDEFQRSIKARSTVMQNLKKGTGFIESMAIIGDAIEKHRPDAIVNFFEPLAGIYNLLRRPDTPMICVGHQYMYLHPAYPFPRGKRPQRMGARYFTRLTSFDSACRLALSYKYVPGRPRLKVLPPLLRPELFRQPLDQRDDFYLIYLLKNGYAGSIIDWHLKRPDVELHCFWDHPGHRSIYRYDETLTFHPLNDVAFLNKMARCKGLVSTAGFESICEAMYLGKPIFSVPVEGHVEQYWNALDLAAFGGGVYDTEFNIERLFDVPPLNENLLQTFRGWVDRAPLLFLEAIEETIASKTMVGN